MMRELITHGFAAVYLLSLPWFINSHNFLDRVAFKVAPTLIGAALALQVYGKFMGWPS